MTSVTPKFFVIPWKMTSESSKQLASALDSKRVYNDDRTKFKLNNNRVLINWGCGQFTPKLDQEVHTKCPGGDERLTYQLDHGAPKMKVVPIFDSNENVTGIKPFILNRPANVKTVVNKIKFYDTAAARSSGITPEFKKKRIQAIRWLVSYQYSISQRIVDHVMVRKITSGSGGSGCVIINAEDVQAYIDSHNMKHSDFMDFQRSEAQRGTGNFASHNYMKWLDVVLPEEIVPTAPLYTKYIKKTREFRVHIVGETILSIVEKKRTFRVPDDEVNWQIRTFNNGWIYSRKNLKKIPQDVSLKAKEAMAIFGLDFGAVDIVWSPEDRRSYVLEINTAPGLQGTTIYEYANAIKAMVTRQFNAPAVTF